MSPLKTIILVVCLLLKTAEMVDPQSARTGPPHTPLPDKTDADELGPRVLAPFELMQLARET